jgi:hypothetical protein
MIGPASHRGGKDEAWSARPLYRLKTLLTAIAASLRSAARVPCAANSGRALAGDRRRSAMAAASNGERGCEFEDSCRVNGGLRVGGTA